MSQSVYEILKYFHFAHLPPHLQEISKPFYELAKVVAEREPDKGETKWALRKLLEAKDCAVRAML